LKKGQRVYDAAQARHPERWSGKTRSWVPVTIVRLNPKGVLGRNQKGGLSGSSDQEVEPRIKKREPAQLKTKADSTSALLICFSSILMSRLAVI